MTAMADIANEGFHDVLMRDGKATDRGEQP
jgi:hypothetical protein